MSYQGHTNGRTSPSLRNKLLRPVRNSLLLHCILPDNRKYNSSSDSPPNKSSPHKKTHATLPLSPQIQGSGRLSVLKPYTEPALRTVSFRPLLSGTFIWKGKYGPSCQNHYSEIRILMHIIIQNNPRFVMGYSVRSEIIILFFLISDTGINFSLRCTASFSHQLRSNWFRNARWSVSGFVPGKTQRGCEKSHSLFFMQQKVPLPIENQEIGGTFCGIMFLHETQP